MTVLERLSRAIVVPVVVIDRAEDAVPTAKALSEGGVDVMEITFRTSAAPQAIKAVSENCPDVIVGAGTILDVGQCKLAVEMGAKFIVSPGYNSEVVDWCIENGIPVTPGCVTPTEITAAVNKGLKVVKFFPANLYGGLNAIKNLSSLFSDIKFMPTGGVNTDNIREYTDMPFIHAVGGSWVCPRTDISSGNFGNITRLCAEARAAATGVC